jgi:hypothetical protein
MLGYVATLLVGFLAACYFLARPFRDLSDGQATTLKRAVLILSGVARPRHGPTLDPRG